MSEARARGVFHVPAVLAASGIGVILVAEDGAPRVAFWALFGTLLAIVANIGAALVPILFRIRRKAVVVDRALCGRFGPDHITPSDRMPR